MKTARSPMFTWLPTLAALVVAVVVLAGTLWEPLAPALTTPPASLERLLQAARRGDLPGLRQALAAGAPINGGDPIRGETALIRAARFGQAEAVSQLLAAGAGLQVLSAGSASALHAAAEGGHVALIHQLVKAGLGVDDGRARQQPTPLRSAWEARQPPAIEALLALGAQPDGLGNSLADLIGSSLGTASAAGDLPSLRVLIRAGIGINQANRFDQTPLLVVLEHCHRQGADQVAAALVAAGADLRAKTREGRSVPDEARRRLRGEPRCKAVAEILERAGGGA